MCTVKHTHTHIRACVKGITRPVESGCWIFPPFLCQPFISRSKGGWQCGAKEVHRESESGREMLVSSFSHWPSAKNILYWFVCGGNREYVSNVHEPDLPVCLSVHLPSVVSTFTCVSSSTHQVCMQCKKL